MPVKRHEKSAKHGVKQKSSFFGALSQMLKLRLLGLVLAAIGVVVFFLSRAEKLVFLQVPFTGEEMLSRIYTPIRYQAMTIVSYVWYLAAIGVFLIVLGFGLFFLSFKRKK